mmetsp:Transcript_9274/g.19452  ORF Transcript_9274/g.19452 Transcript_9274/m.19452 type:complete len:199 (+) Transcript_9274:88-684(+)|eukprot:CAMPEP_0201124100 /NCGR_PEP_ID=MMETSP0850-20130426/10561_1 /ASSEMBLY_ACC=CAM_ASM_000622 /TAXON_ID=183588 /ORGANISM="Pseudo-nitzschia fraudulenta, Strain WWA7" /LENGTH=198 /DNA_ID=CAMNT_0047391293 /DNA_START=90 /DNA_END=686 /DNA_ORIENTATION=-
MGSQPKKFVQKNGINVMNPKYLAWKKAGGTKDPIKLQDPIDKILLHIHVFKASDLMAMDRNVFGKRTSSDPYVKVMLKFTPTVARPGTKIRPQFIDLGRTTTQKKNLSPTWDFDVKTVIPVVRMSEVIQVVFHIFDEDKISSDDLLGKVELPPIKWGNNKGSKAWHVIPKDSAKKVSGKIQLKVDSYVHRMEGLQSYF